MRRSLILISAIASACASGPKVKAGPAAALPFIEDDHVKALALAKERKVPLFVDTWAPWCHSCVFLREHVLPSPELAKHQNRFVFLALNTEKPEAVPFLAQYPVDNWPTLFVIDSATGRLALKWIGTATAPQLEALFDDGERAVKEATGEDIGALLVQADGQYAQGKPQLAALTYGKVARKADSSWDRRPRVIESWVMSLWKSKQLEDCARTARNEVPALPKGTSWLNASVVGLGCAMEAEDDKGWKKDAVAALEGIAREALGFEGLLADDKSGLYESLISVREAAKDEAGTRELGVAWLNFLEEEAKKATHPAARAVFDAHRVGAAIAAGMPARAEAALKQSEAEFPDDYNPPARLAIIYRELGKLDDALKAIDRALGKAYGPRKLRLFETRASVQAKKNDTSGQKATLQKALDYGRDLPAPQRPDKTLARLEASLKALP